MVKVTLIFTIKVIGSCSVGYVIGNYVPKG